MKGKIKEWIFIGFVFLAVVICVSAINTYNNAVTYLEFAMGHDESDEILALENELKILDYSECTKEIQLWIDYAKDSAYNKTRVKINEFFYNDVVRPNILDINKCIYENDIVDRHKKDLMFTGAVFHDGTIIDYYDQFIISFYKPDYDMFNVESIRYNSYRWNLLELIEDMIRFEKEKVVETDVQE